MAAPKTLREVVLARVEQTIRRTFDDEGDVIDDLDLKSDEELLAWYDRIRDLDMLAKRRREPENPDEGRRYRVDPSGPFPLARPYYIRSDSAAGFD